MYSIAITTSNSSILFKIKNSYKYIAFIVFGPLGTIKVSFNATICLNLSNLYSLWFSHKLLENLNRNLSYGSSVAYLLKMGVANLFKGYRAVIRVIGVGYKLELIKSNHLQISLGFSHKIKLKIPYYIKIHIFKKKTIVWGHSLRCVQQFCYMLADLKIKDVYNGKGIMQPHLKKKLKIGKISRF